MNTTRHLRGIALLAIPVAGIVGVLGTGCSQTSAPTAASTSGTGTSVAVGTGSSTTAAGPTGTGSGPSGSSDGSGSSNGSGSSAGAGSATTSGGGSPSGATSGTSSGTKSGTSPAVTSITGPGHAECADTTSSVAIMVSYTVVNAKNIEYLAPSSERPGAGPASGTVTFNYDCSKASEIFKIRAFNTFAANGSDAQDPSPYVSVTVTRQLASGTSGGATTTTTTKIKAPGTTVAVSLPKP